ncbi:MAG: hypothetical protein Q9224_003878 [Gallowayella concinna]
MFFSMHAVLALVFIPLQTIYGHPRLLSNFTAANSPVSTTRLGTAIPEEFSIERRFALPLHFSPEACYINIIAALCDIAGADFASTMPPTNYGTVRFDAPLVKIGSHGDAPIPTRYVVWGLFLVAFYLRANDRFSLVSFGLQWQRKDVATIGIGGEGPKKETLTAEASLASLTAVRELGIEYEYFGSKNFGMNAVYMTIIGALTTTAPFDINTRITEPWISFLNNEPCILVVVPTTAARTSAPYFLYQDLNVILAKTSDFFADHARYTPLSLNISVDGVEVAKATLTSKLGSHGLPLSAIGSG